VRAGNVIGGGDWAPDRIIPDSVRALAAGEPIIVRNPDAIRPWQHVLEPLSGYLRLGGVMLADGRRYAGAWNFGPTQERSDQPVRWVVERFLAEWGSGSWTTPHSVEGQPHEAQRLSLDSAKARAQLEWAPVWDPSTAVRRTASWYREYYRAPARARELVEHELQAYQDDARSAGLAWAREHEGRSTR
jgi:CDP-glucose 4,6-dehydratase